MTWSPSQYRRFEDERTRPARDLVAAIPLANAALAIDLGCGPGNSTEVLAARYPSAVVHGIDSSEEMIRAAQQRLPQLDFEVADIADWHSPQPVDVILANASLQWLPDHQNLFPRLLSVLAEGGCLAVQTPDNLDEPSHQVARAIASSGSWSRKLAGVKLPDRHDAVWYHDLLKPLCARVDIWRTTYYHAVADHAAIVEWFRGSALLPFLAPLSDDERRAFLAEYHRAISAAYAPLLDGTVLLPFPRLFVVWVK